MKVGVTDEKRKLVHFALAFMKIVPSRSVMVLAVSSRFLKIRMLPARDEHGVSHLESYFAVQSRRSETLT